MGKNQTADGLFAGWMQKRHQSSKVLGSQWGTRYFRVCEEKGRLHVSKGPRKEANTIVSLSEVGHIGRLSQSESGGVRHAFEVVAMPVRVIAAARDEQVQLQLLAFPAALRHPS